MFVKINSERHYLWRAVDHEGEVLESFVTKARDKKAALKFLKKTMRKHGQPNVIVTDRLRSYGAALNKVEEALDYLERVADIGTVSEDWMRYDEDLNNLRSHERFKAILKKVAA